MRRITKAEKILQEERDALEVENFNLKYPTGQRVRFWTGVREGEGRTGATWSIAQLACSGHPIVYIRDDAGKNVGSVSLSHVEAITS